MLEQEVFIIGIKTNGTNNRAVALTDLAGANLAPTFALQTMVSDVDRHVICFGADPLNASGTARNRSNRPSIYSV